MSLRTVSETEAPTPTVFAVTPSIFGCALFVDAEVDAAVSEIAPLPASTAAVDEIEAVVLIVRIATETEPATPIVPAAAPEVVSVSNVFVASAPFTVMSASSVTPLATTAAPTPIVALFVTSARFTATAAPTPSVPASVAEPSAFAVPSAFSDEESLKSPPAVTDSPSGSEAVAEAVCMFTEIAAATSTAEPPLSDVVAFGVVVLPDPDWPFELAVLFARPSWLFDCAFVSPASFEFLSFAPEALAVESASLADEPCALNVTAPPAVRLRAVVALTRWLAIVSPRAAPTPTLSPFAEPSALLEADAVCVAVSVIAPAVVSAVAPEAIVADVVTFESTIATSAVSATPPAAPFFAKPVAASVVVADRDSAPTPVSVAFWPTDAVVVSLRTVSDTDAPTPTVFAVTPSIFGCALFVDEDVETAFSDTSPPPALTVAPAPIDAVVPIVMIPTETEPATPIVPAAAPDVVSVSNVSSRPRRSPSSRPRASHRSRSRSNRRRSSPRS